MLEGYIKLMRLHRPIGIALLLWPTLWALWIAGHGHPELLIVGVFVAGVVIMRSAGCVINDIADRHFDGHVARTAERPLVTGQVTVKQAWILFICLCLCAFALVLLLNQLTVMLAVLALILSCLYPLCKRYTHLPQVVLGLAWYMAIPMAFAAQLNVIPHIAWLLYVSAILWTVIYDTFYAMVDRPDDQTLGLKSTAILLGRYDLSVIALLQVIVIALWSWLGWLLHGGLIYFSAVIVAAGLFIYQLYLARQRDAQGCFRAFLNNNWVGLVMFIGIFLGGSH